MAIIYGNVILDFKVPDCSLGDEVYCMWLWYQQLSCVFKETWQQHMSRGNQRVCVMEYSGAPLGKWNLSRPHTETCSQGLLLIQAFLHLVPSSRVYTETTPLIAIKIWTKTNVMKQKIYQLNVPDAKANSICFSPCTTTLIKLWTSNPVPKLKGDQ